MGEYTFETAALKAVTIDAVKYNEEGLKNSLTADVVKEVVPMAFGEWTVQPDTFNKNGSIAIGNYARTKDTYSVALGSTTRCDLSLSVAVGHNTQTSGLYSLSAGVSAVSKSKHNITIGFGYNEKVDNVDVTRTCTTEGQGSITIGAGANTLNNGDTESSNSVTIGCKAENKGADSVVIGAQASNTGNSAVVIGAGCKGKLGAVMIGTGSADTSSISIGKAVSSASHGIAMGYSTSSFKWAAAAIGYAASANGEYALALGQSTKAQANNAIAIGKSAQVADYGATVIRSTAEDGTITQLYFSGANTPLATTYEDGEAMMGYVTKDAQGNILAAGTNKLSALFPNNSTFQPAALSLDDEWVAPKVFHPSDLDLPIEEPTEPEEYQPLPVYPIVEPEIEEEQL